MRANFAKAAATGDEAPLYFYSHLFLSHPETREHLPGVDGAPARPPVRCAR